MSNNNEILNQVQNNKSNNKAKIKEIFASIQGEGLYIGYKQLFIRFCGCNLNCNYCDTDYSAISNYKEYEPIELANEVLKHKDIHSVSLTGGEPLLSVEFLKEFLPIVKNCHSEAESTNILCQTQNDVLAEESHKNNSIKVYLETNATLTENLLEIKPYIDIISADIKLESATGIKDSSILHDKFFEACKGVETFAKVVFNDKITQEEIDICSKLAIKHNIPLILQPEMKGNNFTSNPAKYQEIFDKFLSNYQNVRLIPQVHKFLNVQ